MELLPGFGWPVPRAFASAVAVCRFEQGDVLYDGPGAYERWPKRGPRDVGHWIQVIDPPRTARTSPADAEGNRFAANWVSPVTLRLGRPGRSDGAADEIRSTQGRLFTCLWRGVPELLAEDAGEEPPVPAGARELQKQLDATTPAVREALAGEGRLWFVSVVDESSEASLAKRRAVEAALAAHYAPESVSLSPAEAGVPDGDDYHPALRIRASAIEGAEAARVEELLKRALYAPTRASGETGSDRFKLERHGLLLSATSEEDAEADEPG